MRKRRVFALLASFVLVVTMCFAGTGTIFAVEKGGSDTIVSKQAAEPEEIDLDADLAKGRPIGDLGTTDKGTYAGNNTTINPQNINTVKSPSEYNTPTPSQYTTYNYYVPMSGAGTIVIGYTDTSKPYINISGASYGTIEELGGVSYKYYTVSRSGTYQLQISTSSTIYFQVLYAPASTKTLSNGKVYFHGCKSSDGSTVTKFKVKAPSKGYLTVTMQDACGNEYYTLKAKTAGFSDYVTFNKSRNVRWIGVKKGTYTFSVKGYTPLYAVKVKFTKVKESKYGTKKYKAKKIKKRKTQKALMITKGQKAHWYKFKNPKTQKVKLVLKTKLTNTGNTLGGLQITVYKGSRSFGSRVLYDDTKSYTYIPYNIFSSEKLTKGTYYIKVAPYKKGTGYFTLTWR